MTAIAPSTVQTIDPPMSPSSASSADRSKATVLPAATIAPSAGAHGFIGKHASRRRVGSGAPYGAASQRAEYRTQRTPRERGGPNTGLRRAVTAVGGRIQGCGGRLTSVGARIQDGGGPVTAVGDRIQSCGGRITTVGARIQSCGGRLTSVGARIQSCGGSVTAVGARIQSCGASPTAGGGPNTELRRAPRGR